MRVGVFGRFGMIAAASLLVLLLAASRTAPGVFAKLLPAAGVLLLLVMGATLFFSTSNSRRIRRLSAFVKRTAEGDFAPLDRDYRNDDLGDLSIALGATLTQYGQTFRTLTDERNRSAAILASMVEGVAVISGDERIVYCNVAFEQILELPRGISQSRKLVQVVRQAELVAAVRKVLQKETEVTGEVEVGTVRPRSFSVTAAPVTADRDKSAVLVLHDITELRRLERVRRDFVANVSHEFKTPLTAIQGFAETLIGGAIDDKEHRMRFLEIIREHAWRLARLTDDLLKLSRIEAGRLELDWRPVSVRGVVNGCMETLNMKAEQKGVVVTARVPDDLPPVRGDNAQVSEVLQNLLDNAVQYTPKGGRIEVSAVLDGAGVTFTVADSGIGIPEADLERIFERFYRVDAARSREAGGTGLGLSIARHIVEAHGGKIWVESAIGYGSKFHFSIPVFAAQTLS